MTMRTYRYFKCRNGHSGEEKTSENDQPYSRSWESVSAKGMVKCGTDAQGNDNYVCAVCQEAMEQVEPTAKQGQSR